MNKRKTGQKYEDLAASYLEGRGFLLLERNFKCRQGEVDIIGIHENCLVFVEVKYRKNVLAGGPEEAVSIGKQLKICMTSDYYRFLNPVQINRQVRYDVVGICGKDIIWYKNAFSYLRKSVYASW